MYPFKLTCTTDLPQTGFADLNPLGTPYEHNARKADVTLHIYTWVYRTLLEADRADQKLRAAFIEHDLDPDRQAHICTFQTNGTWKLSLQ
jgi:hypothetical protein